MDQHCPVSYIVPLLILIFSFLSFFVIMQFHHKHEQVELLDR